MLLPETLRHLQRHIEDALPEHLHAKAYWTVSSFLMALDFCVPAPGSVGSDEGIVLLCWDRGAHHFEIQIGVHEATKEGYIEYFYYNRTASFKEGQTWLDENKITDPVNATALAKLTDIHQRVWGD